MKYDIFVSYSRKDSAVVQSVVDQLKADGCRCWMDINGIESGDAFKRVLVQAIKESKLVLFFSSANSNNTEWTVKEINIAVGLKKPIIPVRLDDAPYDDSILFDLSGLDYIPYQKKSIHEAGLEKLRRGVAGKCGVATTTLHDQSNSKPASNVIRKALMFKRWYVIAPVVAAIATVILAAAGIGIGLNVDRIFPYPFTQEQKKQVKMLSVNMMLVGEAYSEFMSAENELHNAAERSMLAGDKSAFDDAASMFSHRLKKARGQYSAAFAAATDFTRRVDKMPIDYADMQMFLESLSQELRLADDVAPSLERVCDPNFPCEKDDRLRVLNCKRQMHDTRSDIFSVSVMGIFCKISPDALADFKMIAIRWTQFGLLSEPWLRDEKEIERKGEALCNKLEAEKGELQTIVRTQNAALAMERELALYKKQLMDMGATAEQADAQVAKLRKMAELKQRLANAQESLGEIKERARTKFAPKDDDDVGILWGKALRFRTMNMPEDIKHCIEVLRKRNTSEFPSAALDVAEAVFFPKDELPFKSGVLVCSYEPPATNHAIYKIGDVITGVNGKPCLRYEDYRNKAGNAYTIYRRNAKGGFDKLTATLPEGQPRVALVNLMEDE